MTFMRFEEIFKSAFPEGEVFSHGEFGGTEKSMKTTAVFAPGGKCYSYYGAYDIVLQKMGLKVISKERFREMEIRLEDLKARNGKEDSFFGFTVDCSKEIEELEKKLGEYRRDYIIA